MFQISPDQTQWFHLYRVQKTFPITFVIFACEEVTVDSVSSWMLDLRIMCAEQNIMGGSWRVRTEDDNGKQVTRADCTKFLELHARFSIANTTKRGFDEIELIESSRDELALAASFDASLRNILEAVAPTLAARLARNLIYELGVNQTGIEFEELTDWPARNSEVAV